MASLWERTRTSGTTYISVRFRHEGQQTTQSFDDREAAVRFQSDVDKYGPGRALELLKANAPTDAVTVSAWCRHHIDHLTGVEKGTRARYESYLDRIRP